MNHLHEAAQLIEAFRTEFEKELSEATGYAVKLTASIHDTSQPAGAARELAQAAAALPGWHHDTGAPDLPLLHWSESGYGTGITVVYWHTEPEPAAPAPETALDPDPKPAGYGHLILLEPCECDEGIPF